jgi:hypothetical protein
MTPVLGSGKISRKRIKIRENLGGGKFNLEHFSLLQLLPNLHGF